MHDLTVVTWNIAGGHTEQSVGQFDYDPDENAQYFIDQLHSKNADIIFLQESHWHAENSLTKRIADALGMQHFETSHHPSHIDPEFHISSAILSKPPLQNQRAVKLPYPTFELRFADGREAAHYDKYLQIAELDGMQLANIHTQPLSIFGYDYATGDGLAYTHEIEALLQSQLQTPLLFAGVLNFEHVAEVLPSLTAKFGLKDSLPDEQTRSKGKHIDYLLYSPEFSVKASGIDQTSSDHYLCWARLTK